MSCITDELRKYISSMVTRGISPICKESLLAIADRIDAAHEDALSRLYMDMSDAEYIELPKDSDGVPIHLDDVMDGVNKYDTNQEVTGRVTTISFDATLDPNDSTSVGIRVWADDHKSYRVIYIDPHASIYRHHKQPTVEDVLRDMHAKLDEVTALYVGEAIDSDERDSDEARIFAEYASKLWLAGDAE